MLVGDQTLVLVTEFLGQESTSRKSEQDKPRAVVFVGVNTSETSEPFYTFQLKTYLHQSKQRPRPINISKTLESLGISPCAYFDQRMTIADCYEVMQKGLPCVPIR